MQVCVKKHDGTGQGVYGICPRERQVESSLEFRLLCPLPTLGRVPPSISPEPQMLSAAPAQ
jgi:hypothetical protein